MPYLNGKINYLFGRLVLYWELARKGPDKDAIKKIIKKKLKNAINEIEEYYDKKDNDDYSKMRINKDIDHIYNEK